MPLTCCKYDLHHDYIDERMCQTFYNGPPRIVGGQYNPALFYTVSGDAVHKLDKNGEGEGNVQVYTLLQTTGNITKEH